MLDRLLWKIDAMGSTERKYGIIVKKKNSFQILNSFGQWNT